MIQHCYAMMADLPDHRRHTLLSFYDVLVWFLFYSAYYEVKIKIVKKQELANYLKRDFCCVNPYQDIMVGVIFRLLESPLEEEYSLKI